MTAVPVMARVPLARDSRPRPVRLPDGRPALRRPAVDLEVVVPAYNEAERLPATVAATVDYLSAQPWESRIVVVDNGSSDGTAQVTRALADPSARVPVTVIGCARPGKGAAVRRGVLTSEITVRRLLRCRPRDSPGDAGHRDETCSARAPRRSSPPATPRVPRCCAASRCAAGPAAPCSAG